MKLAGKDDATIRKTLDKRYENSIERTFKYNSNDAFQSFMAAYTTSVDPHTDYFGAKASAEFDISMKLSLVGIGAVLQKETTIRRSVNWLRVVRHSHRASLPWATVLLALDRARKVLSRK